MKDIPVNLIMPEDRQLLTVPDILEYVIPKLRKEVQAGRQEHNDSWRQEYVEHAMRHFGGSYPSLILYHIDRKLTAYEQNGNPHQILQAAVYILCAYGIAHNRQINE